MKTARALLLSTLVAVSAVNIARADTIPVDQIFQDGSAGIDISPITRLELFANKDRQRIAKHFARSSDAQSELTLNNMDLMFFDDDDAITTKSNDVTAVVGSRHGFRFGRTSLTGYERDGEFTRLLVADAMTNWVQSQLVNSVRMGFPLVSSNVWSGGGGFNVGDSTYLNWQRTRPGGPQTFIFDQGNSYKAGSGTTSVGAAIGNSIAAVPEPNSFILIATGLLSLASRRRSLLAS